jgi:purine-nucleoside phosphorylase
MTPSPPSALSTARAHLHDRLPAQPELALVLGSGLGGVADALVDAVRIPYEEIPGFPRVTVSGHTGALVCGSLGGVPVAALQGRFHAYEGWSQEEVVLPVRLLSSLGASRLLVTNAAGGIRPGLVPGDLMLISDHLNLMGRSPLAGPVAEGEERFPDMSDPYDAAYRRVAERVALARGIPLQQGVYAALLGPSYETPSEIRMLARLGADAVGMSTVPEVIVARARGMRVLGISCITNLAAGLGGEKLDHAEVMEVGARVRDRMAELILALVPALLAGEE